MVSLSGPPLSPKIKNFRGPQLAPSNLHFWKAGAKVLLFFELTKYFCIFFIKKCIFGHFYPLQTLCKPFGLVDLVDFADIHHAIVRRDIGLQRNLIHDLQIEID